MIKIHTFFFILTFFSGIMLHEFGHYTMAHIFGAKNVKYSYKEVEIYFEEREIFSKELPKYTEQVKNNQDYPLKKQFDNYLFKLMLTAFAAPLLILGLGLFGWFLTQILEKNTFFWWLFFYLAIFLGQFVCDFFLIILYYLLGLNIWQHDLCIVSAYFKMPLILFPVIFFVISGILLYYLIFKILDKELQKNIIISGILGSLFGYLLWFHLIGKILFP